MGKKGSKFMKILEVADGSAFIPDGKKKEKKKKKVKVLEVLLPEEYTVKM